MCQSLNHRQWNQVLRVRFASTSTKHDSPAMSVDTSAIEEILRYARLQNETEEGVCFKGLVDRLVLPGMVLRLNDEGAGGSSWSFGSGLCLIPTKRIQRSAKQIDSVMVHQFGILRHAVSTNPLSTAVVRRPKDSALTVQHCLWLERPYTATTIATRTLAPLTRSTFRCAVNHFHVGDRVVGTVVRRVGDNFAVDVGCGSLASLNYLSFEGASKRNRPDIGPGDVVYATVTQADRDLEIELSCVDEAGRASGMGILGRHEPGTVGNAGGMAGGVMLHCSPDLVRRLSDQEKFPLLKLLAKNYPFEVCMGANGRIWLTARSPRETTLLVNAIALAEHISPNNCCEMAQTLC
ncbi:Exosome complex exonuclease RRP40 [Paragonimus heterotremus]|uniref:Ribosomal RNA-processing protein 40 n=1 Tax=Paragonimus heterotremus TaxID=100268 RepID=A0A8J4WED4_9TREM|nr:Exosome complex exonuclease RRP40 [Paragonimus heterotremus]